MNAPTEPIDTTTSGGKPIAPVFGVLAECERDNIRERTPAGMAEGGDAQSLPRLPINITDPTQSAKIDDK